MELFWEPRKQALSKIEQVLNEPEMTEFESAFVCGLIREKRPKKILEIGVAAGGTTAIIMQCIDMLGLNEECEIISVDLNKKFYRGDGRDTGFLGTELKSKVLNGINHKFLLGSVIAECIEEIGKGIDFVILDTVHFLPGEVLDFPVVLPFMSPDAVIVLHDVAYHHYCYKEGVSTQVLLDAITGEKIIPFGEDKNYPNRMPNISAVRINKDSKKYIDSVFHAMTLPWYYLPKQIEIDAYRFFYSKYYDRELVDVFDIAVELNRNLLEKRTKCKLPVKDRIIRATMMLLRGYY